MEVEIYEESFEYSKKIEKRRNKEIDNQVILWLASNINRKRNAKSASNSEIRDMLQNQIAVLYLLVWPIMEQHHFGGFMHFSQIKTAAYELAKYYDEELREDLDEIICRLFYRFNVNNKNEYYKKLEQGILEKKNRTTIINILKKNDYAQLSPEDKLYLILYVIFRYRNNIFHGNKDISEWAYYEQQINDCLVGMMKISDCMRNNGIKIKQKENKNNV